MDLHGYLYFFEVRTILFSNIVSKAYFVIFAILGFNLLGLKQGGLPMVGYIANMIMFDYYVSHFDISPISLGNPQKQGVLGGQSPPNINQI